MKDREQSHQNRCDTACFSSGEKNHIAKYYPDKDKVNKCFNCHLFGHPSFKCLKKGPKPKVSNIILNVNTPS